MSNLDVNDIQVIITNVDHLEKKLRTIIDDEQKVVDRLQENANTLFELEIKAALKKMDVEEVNRDKLGIRVSALKAADYTNMYTVCNASLEALSSVHGIGKDSAQQIRKAAKKIENETRKNAKIHFLKNNDYSNQLAQSIFWFINLKSIYIKTEELYNNEHEKIMQAIQIIQKSGLGHGPFGTLFINPNQKKVINEQTEYLRSLLNGSYREMTMQYQHELNEIKSIPMDTIISDLTTDLYKYGKIVNIFLPGKGITEPAVSETKVGNKETQTKSTVKEEKPKEIIKEVIKEVPKEKIKYVEKVVEKVVKDTSLDPIYMNVYAIYENLPALSKLKMMIEGKREPYMSLASNILDDHESIEEKSEKITELYEAKMISKEDLSELTKYISKSRETTKVEVHTDLIVVNSDYFIANLVDTVFIQQTSVTPSPEEFTLYFIDEDENKISNEYVLKTDHQDISEPYKIRFEFDKQTYDAKKQYYLLMLDSGKNVFKKVPFKIDIAFADDFDF